MNTIGLIAEYNPLHNGHIYQINEIKKMYPDSLIILCVGRYFTERGDIGILYHLVCLLTLLINLSYYFHSQILEYQYQDSLKSWYFDRQKYPHFEPYT